MIVSRDFDDLEPETRRRVEATEAAMDAMGHPIFVYVTYRDLEAQAREQAEGDTDIARGQHNLKNPETGDRAAQAVDAAFKGSRPWSDSHPWDLLHRVARAVGLKVPIPEGDAGHLIYRKKGVTFAQLWAAQAHHH